MTPAPVQGALKRYRVMAYVTGVFLLLLTTVVIVQFVDWLAGWNSDGVGKAVTIVGTVHGWVFMIYMLACADLWRRMKWELKRLLTMVLGGVVPAMSFVMERRVSREVPVSVDA
jgi:integral membrane protein